jgi:hypothetical protein
MNAELVEGGGIIDYGTARYERHGLVTTLGIASILMGLFGLIGSFFCGGQVWFIFPLFGDLNAAATDAEVRLTEAQAAIVVEALNETQEMPAAYQQFLQRILPHVDVPLDPLDDGTWTTDHVQSQIASPTTRATPAGEAVYIDLVPSRGTIGVCSPNRLWASVHTDRGNLIEASLQGNDSILLGHASHRPLGFCNDPTQRRIVLILSVLAIAIGIALATWLLVAGIRTLGRPPSGLWMHRVWWPIKLMHVAMIFVLLAWAALTFEQPIAVITPNDVFVPSSVFDSVFPNLLVALIGIAIWLAYPVAVFIVLRTKATRAAAEV